MPSYPALLDLTKQTLHSLGTAASFVVGRNESADICVLDPSCSRHHFRIVSEAGRYKVQPLNALNPTYVNGQPIIGAEALEHGALLQAGQTRFQFLLRAADADAGRVVSVKQVSAPVSRPSPAEDAGTTVFPITGAMTIGREQSRVQIYLPHPQVSRCHARIGLEGATATLTDLASANGTFVNGQQLRGATILQPGDQIDIGPYALQFTGRELVSRPRSDNIELIARGVQRTVKNRDDGRPLRILDDITLVIKPREFVCLLGPSGSGKSTLLSALSGRTTPDAGTVEVNGADLHANFEALKQDIAVVPQKDVLHEALPVGKALWYTAKLRLPPDTAAAEIETSLSEMLETVGLAARRGTCIRHLSGGQVKRASLANEILCKPSLLFLDEVTSGLDEQTDREVMNLFRSLADAGKTVVCVTHSLANVERTCHLVVVLTAGGMLAFFGKPAEALSYFGIERLGDVYDRLARQPAEHWQQAFAKSPYWQRYIGSRLPPPSAPRVLAAQRSSRSQGATLGAGLRQALLLTTRYAAIWRGDALALAAMAGQALAVGLLLGLLFGNLQAMAQDAPADRFEHARRSVNLMFLLGVSAFWFGCNNAAKEIVKERTIYTRERDFNLNVGSYYASKLLLLSFFSILQTVLLFAVVRAWCHPPGGAGSILTVLLALTFTGATLGLAISALAPTEEMAITLIPMAIIPQIILSGVVCPLEGVSRTLARLAISTYWGRRGLDGALPDSVAEAAPGLEAASLGLAVLVLMVHAAVCIGVALAALYVQSRRARGR